MTVPIMFDMCPSGYGSHKYTFSNGAVLCELCGKLVSLPKPQYETQRTTTSEDNYRENYHGKWTDR